jgi:hypothetical protein
MTTVFSATVMKGLSEMRDPPKEEEEGEESYDSIVAGVERCERHIEPKCDEEMLWSVTTIARSAMYGGTRCVAVCLSFDRAMQIVESNEGDIWETTYQLAVIEGVYPDQLYPTTPELQFWFVWDRKSRSYVPIRVPTAYESTYGFGLG